VYLVMAEADRRVGTHAARLDQVDEAGFAEWVGPHLPAMARLAARLAPSADRDDIVQEALYRAWRKRRLYDPDRGEPAAWLLAITADRARKAAQRRSIPLWIRPPARAGSVDDRIDLEEAIKRLAPRQRLAVDCFYFAGLTVAQTAAVMGCSEGTVKSTLADARGRLRALLGTRT
jgi:RNA polymerase sigma factor (sigma-70 family)